MVHFQIDSGGKRVRPMLVMVVAEAFGEDPSRLDRFAAAVELVHNASLVHDDIQDGDETRRGLITAWKRYGEAQAINLGDLLFSLGFDLVQKLPYPPATRLEVVSRCLDAIRALVCGQILELDLGSRGRHSEQEYFEVIDGKTAALFSLSLAGAGVLAGASPEEIDLLHEMGRDLGRLFQIRDDVIDVLGRKEGREEGADIREGKITLMSSRFLNSGAADTEKRRALDILNKAKDATTDADVTFVLDLYRRHGCIDEAVREYAALDASVRSSVLMNKNSSFQGPMSEVLALLDPRGMLGMEAR